MRTVTATLDGLGFPEALRWRGGALWLSDMFRGRVLRWVPGEEPRVVVDVARGGPEVPGGLGWLPDGDLLVVDCLGRRVLRVDADGRIAVHADLADRFPHPANDMHVDPDGTAWVGGYGFDPETDEPRPSRLARIAPDGSVAETGADLVFPNGCERRPDGRLVVAETFADRVAITSPDAGEVVATRALPAGSGPDGLSLDGDDVLVAAAFAGRVLRLTPGEVRDEFVADAIPDGPGAGPVGCYDVAIDADSRRVAVAIASLDEPLAMRVDTGRVVILEPTPAR